VGTDVTEEIFEEWIAALKARVDPLARLVHEFAASLSKPFRYHSGQEHHGYRYAKPGVEHFCLLKAARVVSSLNAMIALARQGYVQEIYVLLRTMVEFTTHIEYVLESRDDTGKLEPKAEKYVDDFFADYQRNSRDDFKKAQVPQYDVNKRLGASLDEFARQIGADQDRFPAERLYSNVYLTFSNYVHGKYPEIMDMYGGVPDHFHMYGMHGTSKDDETVQMIATNFNTASLAFKKMVKQLKLRHLLETDKVLLNWFESELPLT
jgi:Family of unknown function (DUF5677)